MSSPTYATGGRMFAHPGRAATRGPQWRRAAGWMLAVHLYLAAWFWLIAAVVVTLALVVIDRVGTVGLSIMQFAAQGATWFPFATTIIIATAQIGVHVVNGMTRRSFVRGALLSAVVSASVYALAMSTALVVEGAVYDRLGWPHVQGGVDGTGWVHGFGPSLLEYGLVFLAAQVSGLLVGITYYRVGGWWGTLALPLTVGPVLLVLGAQPHDGRWEGFGLELVTSTGAIVAGALAVVGLAAYAFYRLARTVPIRRVAA